MISRGCRQAVPAQFSLSQTLFHTLVGNGQSSVCVCSVTVAKTQILSYTHFHSDCSVQFPTKSFKSVKLRSAEFIYPLTSTENELSHCKEIKKYR